MRRPLELLVNGGKHRVTVDPARTLLDVLRAELDLTGAKYGCGEGRCGACTVTIDGKATRSCRMRVGDAVGKAVATVEGLEQGGRLHPVQEAFLKHGAMQCGYCIPGMIMASVALLMGDHDVSEDQIVRSMQVNVCRCGNYQRMVAAIRDAARALKGGGR